MLQGDISLGRANRASDTSLLKGGEKTSLTLAHFEEFFRLLPERAESEHSWIVTRQEIEARRYGRVAP
jgi:type I restriction enzyme M protein